MYNKIKIIIIINVNIFVKILMLEKIFIFLSKINFKQIKNII